MRRILLLGIAILIGLAPSGCGDSPPAGKQEVFVEEQRDTITPDGAIDLSSVQETPEGVRYQTSDGSSWEVEMTPKREGGYAYGAVRAVEPSPDR